MNTVNLSKLAKPEEMYELSLLNTLKFSTSDFSDKLQEIWKKRKLDCKMELMKRWTKELQENGIKTKIIHKEPERKRNKKSLLNKVINKILKN